MSSSRYVPPHQRPGYAAAASSITEGSGFAHVDCSTGPSNNRNILFVGASICAGWQVQRGEGWAQQMEQRLRLHNWQVQNIARPGSNSANWRNLLPYRLREQPYAHVVLALSLSNDGVVDDPVGAAQAYRMGVLQSIESILDFQPAYTRIILVSVNPVTVTPGSLNPGVYAALQSINIFMQELVEDNDRFPRVLHLLDFMSPTDAGDGSWKEGLAMDNIHPNAAGHAAMFNNINFDVLLPLLEQAQHSQ